MLTLHHLNHSRSFRILWLLCELKARYGTPFQLISHARNKNHLAPDEMQSIHPMGKAPILIDDTLPMGEQALAESALIVEYLLKVYDKDKIFCANDDLTSWKTYHFWLHFAEGSLMPPLVMGLILHKTIAKSPALIRPIVKKVKQGIETAILSGNVSKSLALLENHLQNKSFIVNDKLTGVDIQLYFAVAGAKKSGVDFTHLPNVNQWLTACEHRESFKKAVEIGGKPF